jgi:hypothetical protein
MGGRSSPDQDDVILPAEKLGQVFEIIDELALLSGWSEALSPCQDGLGQRVEKADGGCASLGM